MGARFNLEGRSFAKADQIDRGPTSIENEFPGGSESTGIAAIIALLF
jgi:hypothetical protein